MGEQGSFRNRLKQTMAFITGRCLACDAVWEVYINRENGRCYVSTNCGIHVFYVVASCTRFELLYVSHVFFLFVTIVLNLIFLG